jgi:hypothetical protein
MSERNDESFDMSMKSSLWLIDQMEAFIIRYRACRTKNEQVKLLTKYLPLAKQLHSRAGFEMKELEIIKEMMDDSDGEDWKKE